MTYVRSLIAKATAATPRVAPLPIAPRFAEVHTRVDEVDEDVLVVPQPRTPARVEQAAPPPPLATDAPPGRASRDTRPEPGDATAAECEEPDVQPIVERTAFAMPAEPSPARPQRRHSSRHVMERVRLEQPIFAEQSVERTETETPLVSAAASRPYARRAVDDVAARVTRPMEHVPPAAGQPQAAGESSVLVSIGRIDVRASVTTPLKVERGAPFRPQLTLEDYLARRSKVQ